jgi:hypothetical protein
MTLYDKNIQSMQVNLETLFQHIMLFSKEQSTVNAKTDIKIETAVNGEQYPVLLLDNQEWELNSRYEPTGAAQIYAKRYEKPRAYAVYFVFGIGDGRAVREMLTHGDDSNFYAIYEPNMLYFLKILEHFDLSDIFLNENVCVTVDSEELLQDAMEGIIDYNNNLLLENCILPNYDMIYPEECANMINNMLFYVQNSKMRRNTIFDFRKEFASHSIFCMWDMLNQTDIYQMQERLKQEDLSGVPVIIVAAGPSLDKNIKELKKAKGKSLIITVDAALRAMQKVGIRPDLGMSVDARVPDRFFEGVDISSTPFLFAPISKESLVEQHKGRHIYEGYPNDIFRDAAIDETGYEITILKSGGSVSTVAYTLALSLGIKTIIFIGQDLAFTGGKSHNGNLGMSEKENKEYLDNRVIVTVEGNDGTMLETDFQMDMYRKWIENAIKRNPPDIRVINATEGGSKIEGAIVKTLSQVIEEECKKDIDFGHILATIPDSFTKEQRGRLIQEFHGIPHQLDDLRKQIKEADQLVGDLQKCIEKEDIDGQKSKIQELAVLNDEIANSPAKDMILYYNSDIEYGIGEGIFTQDISADGLCQRAHVLYAGYQQAIDSFDEELQTGFLDRLTKEGSK